MLQYVKRKKRGVIMSTYGGNENTAYVKYFPLEEYVKKIKLQPYLLEHLERTNCEFDNYRRQLDKYDEDYIVNYWVYSLYEELFSSDQIENVGFDMRKLENKSLLFDTLSINHRRIHELHNFATEGELEPTFEYRKVPVNVSCYGEDGKEHIFWRGANPEDVTKFMNDFIKIYKYNGTSLIFSNPFLVSALIHLLFVRIHPYIDGNGRTARIIHSIKFTETINKLYGTRLKLSPLNLSQSILLNKVTYVNRLDNIYFDLEHDNNDSINAWFDYILDMADEQIYHSTNRLDFIDTSKFSNNIVTSGTNPVKVRSMRINKF